MILWWKTEYTKKLICSLSTSPWVEAVKNGKWKTKDQIRGFRIQFKCFVFPHSSKWKCFSLTKCLQTCIKFFFLADFFFVYFYPPVLFSLCIWKHKREKVIPLLGWRKEHLELRHEEISRLLSGRVHLAVPSNEEELISQTREGDWISRWISDRLFSSDRLCTTFLSSPCHTPFGTSSPPHGVSWFLVLI